MKDIPLVPAAAARQGGDQCPPGERPSYVRGFAYLYEFLGEAMGDAISCEFPDPGGTGELHQLTSRGLAVWSSGTNTLEIGRAHV